MSTNRIALRLVTLLFLLAGLLLLKKPAFGQTAPRSQQSRSINRVCDDPTHIQFAIGENEKTRR
jgi:hypothetical protein